MQMVVFHVFECWTVFLYVLFIEGCCGGVSDASVWLYIQLIFLMHSNFDFMLLEPNLKLIS